MSEFAFELWQVDKSYGVLAKRAALRGVSLRVQRGECYGLAGANGAGKTTLIRILLGLSAPDAGEVRLLGARPEDPEVRKRIGFVPEAAELPPLATPRQLVRRWARLRGLRVQSAQAQGLSSLARLGMGALLDRPAQRLSKGERQRTLLALALLGAPELLVLDEPTDGLDPLGRALVREVIREECEAGRTVFLNSHLLSETERICTRVGFLHKGELVREQLLSRGAPSRDQAFAGTSAISLGDGSPALLVEHLDLAQLNGAIDRLRQGGSQIVEVRRLRQDLETAFVEVAGPGAGRAVTPLSAGPIPDAPAAALPGSEPRARLRAGRTLTATLRVSAEIAAELASRKLGWVVLGGALLATLGFFAAVHSDLIQGAAAGARQLAHPGGFFDAGELAMRVGGGVGTALYWAGLICCLILAALFAPPLLEPRRTVLILAQPISRSDFATGIFAAVCAMALAVQFFLAALLFAGSRALGLHLSAALLAVPLPFLVAFAALYALMLIATWFWRSGFFAALVGLGALSLFAAAGFSAAASPGAPIGPLSALYGLCPHIDELGEQARRLGAGQSVSALHFVSTGAVALALLIVLRVVAGRSER